MEPQTLLAATFFSFLSIFIGGSAGILKNGNFFGDTEYKIKTPLPPTPAPKEKFVFKLQEPTIDESIPWNIPSDPVTISSNPRIKYGKASFGDNWKTNLVDITKPEWFKKGEEIIKKFQEQVKANQTPSRNLEFKTSGMKELKDKIAAKGEAIDGTLLHAWCKESYKQYDDPRAVRSLASDIYYFCHIQRTKES